MKDSRDELAFSWLAQRAQRVALLSADHPLLTDLVICITVAAASVGGLSTQHRLTALAGVFCVALCAPLLLRRVSPILCFAAVTLIALAQWLLAAPQLADAAVLIALYWVTLDGSLLAAGIAAGMVEAGAIMAALRWSPSEPLKIWVGLTGLATAAGVLGVSVRQRRALLASLQEKAAQLEIERDQEGRLGAAAERARIAREMHDIVAHNLSVMIALADGATYAMNTSPERAADATRRVAATGREALVEMRRLLGVLRDQSSVQPLEPQPRLGRLDELLARVHAAGIPVTMNLDGDPHELADGVQLTVFRVAQEALDQHAQARRPTHPRAPLVELPARSGGARGDRHRRASRGCGGRRTGPARHARARRKLRRQARSRSQPPRRLARASTAGSRRGRPGCFTMTTNVLLADDQELMRMAFRMVMDTQPDIEIVGEAANGREAVEAAQRLTPDVVLMDVRMPEMDGVQATRELVESKSSARIIILTTFDLDEYVYAALRAGASGFLLKDTPPADLLSGIRAVASGDAVVAPRVTRRLLSSYAHRLPVPGRPNQGQSDRLESLTGREREVLLEVARSLSNAEIAEHLVLSEATVKSHVGRILSKLGLRDRVQIVVFAYETGLITPSHGLSPGDS